MRVRESLQNRLKDMRPSEAEVTRRLLRDLGLVAEHTLRELAARLGTSDTTVIRACRAAGFDGFQDLKYHVLREFTNGRVPAAPSGQGAYDADLAATLCACDSAVDAAVSLLRPARKVALIGVGASRGVALIAADILFTLHRQALVLLDDQMTAFAFTPPRGVVLMAISHSGETQMVLRVVEEARNLGIPTIGLSNEPASELGRAVDVLLATQAVEKASGSYAIAPRICQLALLDLLFAQLQSTTLPARSGEVTA